MDSSRCDRGVFKDGHSICVLDARSADAEEWVCKVAKESGQRIDWHYSGGRANVLYIGDHAKVRAAVYKLARELRGSILRVYDAPGERGPYRAGDPLLDGVVVLGLHAYRLKDNPEERRLAEAWARENKTGHILAYLLDPHSGTAGRPPEPEREEHVLAATVVQWLGSPVGQCFLRDLGYERKGT